MATTDLVKSQAANYIHAVLQKAQTGRLKQHEVNIAADVMTAYFVWAEANEKRELVERAGSIIEMGRAIGAQAEAHPANVEELLAQSRASNPNNRRKTPTK
jgi:hypothetical protein